MSRSRCEISDDIIVLIWNFLWDMCGHEDMNTINNSFFPEKSRLNLIGFFPQQRSHTSHIIQELRYPRLPLVRWLFPYQWRNPCMFWHVLCLACKYLIFLPICELAVMKQPKNLLHLPKTTKNTCKIANKLMTVPSHEINLQSKHNLICHVAKVKAATSTHSMADVIPFF